jgi:predicted Fe-S protein YdhL (DUF1289 family)
MIPSPCIGICRIDDHSGLCVGCARTRDEIAAWRQMPQELLSRVWAVLPARRARLGLSMHRIGWTNDDLRSFITGTLQPGGGTWVSGVHGAVAEFCVGEDETLDIENGEHAVNARTPRGAVSFRLSAAVHVLALGPAPEQESPDIIVLAVPRGATSLFPDHGLTRIGFDAEAISSEDRGETLYDFGLGRNAAGFGIRTASPELISRLDESIGRQWPELLASVGADILRTSPTRVVRNALGRIEVFTQIPLPGGKSPAGPHTHFLPNHLAAGGDLPPALQIPDGYTSCTVYYPLHAQTRPADEC